MHWFYLLIAGLFEISWAVGLKFSHGFTVLKFTILTIAGMILSFLLLSQAIKTLPLGTSYAIWTGIGAVGAVFVGMLLFKEVLTPLRLFFVLLILAGIIGLKITSAQ